MRTARRAVMVMTAIVVGVTFYEAAFGAEIGRVFIGTSISIAGIFLITLWPPPDHG